MLISFPDGKLKNVKQINIAPGLRLIVGFALLIIVGSILLYLPISYVPSTAMSYVNALFVSTSAVCVTGLTPIDIGMTLTVFGKIVLAILIQIGGLSFASFAIFFLFITGKQISQQNRSLLRATLNSNSSQGLVGLVRTVVTFAFSIEIVGAILTYIAINKDYTIGKAIGISIFHSISSFNNAGFDLFGHYNSLTNYSTNSLMLITTAVLIILGGLGFIVIVDLFHFKSWRKLKNHSRIVLIMTLILLVTGTIAIFFSEGSISWLSAFFESVTTRTAGFNSIDTASLKEPTLVIVMFLMFIGANPGSTGGGIKTTTFFAIIKSLFATGGKKEPVAFKRRIPQVSITKAYSVFVLAQGAIIIASLGILLKEGNTFSLIQVLFEVISAFATVGLSMGITGLLSSCSKVILIIIMFIGRLGPLTMVTSWVTKHHNLRYVEEDILIG